MLGLATSGAGTVTPALNGRLLEVGRTFEVRATPGDGQVFAGWSGGIESTNSTLRFQMRPDLYLQANFIPNPFIPVRGTYRGLFFNPGETRHESSGNFAVTVTRRGAFTARCVGAGKTNLFAGQFDLGGNASRTLRPQKTNELSIELHLDLGGNGDQITGALISPSWRADLFGKQARFNVQTNPAPQSGRHTLTVSGADDSATAPGGNSIGFLVIDRAGTVRFIGALADGTAISQSAVLSGNGDWPFYILLYGGRGSIFGWITIDGGANQFESRVNWFRPQTATGRYSGGFALSLPVFGSRYVPPASGTSVLNFGDGRVTLGGGELPEVLAADLVLSKTGFNVASNAARITLALNVTNGAIRGSFVHPVTKRMTGIKAVVLQSFNEADGFFLGPNQSGNVMVRQR
jgi:hypothetical protein